MMDFEKRTDPRHAVSEEEWLRIRSLKQHLEPTGIANPDWLLSREHIVTGSAVAGAIGNGYHGPMQHLRSKVWPQPFKDNAACLHGNFYERECQAMMCLWLTNRCEEETDDLEDYSLEDESGLLLNRKTGHWMGCSPDGIVHLRYRDGTEEVALLEYKCPYSQRDSFTASHQQVYKPFPLPASVSPRIGASGRRRKKKIKSAENTENGSLDITGYYYDQLQWSMGILRDETILKPRTPRHPVRCFFAVWSFHAWKVQEVCLDPGYYDFQVEQARDWYRRYWKNLAMKEAGQLAENEVVW